MNIRTVDNMAELQPFRYTHLDATLHEDLVSFGTLCFVPAIQIVILSSVGQPCFTYGLIAVATGAIGGIIKNQMDPNALEKAIKLAKNLIRWRRPRVCIETAGLLSPVVLLLPEAKLTQIDSHLPGKNINAERRRWIMTAIDEKLAREDTPDFPVAA